MYSNLTSPPSVCPVDINFLVRHARIDNFDDGDEDLLTMYALTATEMIESYLSRYLITRDVTWIASERPETSIYWQQVQPWQWSYFMKQSVVHLPRPASAVSQVAVGIWGEPDTLLTEDVDYWLDLTTTVGRLRWLSSTYWTAYRDHISVTFTTGYGLTSADVPVSIRHAIALLTTALWENRGDVAPDCWNPGIEALLAAHKLSYYGA